MKKKGKNEEINFQPKLFNKNEYIKILLGQTEVCKYVLICISMYERASVENKLSINKAERKQKTRVVLKLLFFLLCINCPGGLIIFPAPNNFQTTIQ